MRTIADRWSSFARAVLPKTAGNTQRQEMRRAFYGGAAATLAITVEIADADLSDDAGAAVLEGVHDECRRFAAEVEAGRA